MYKQKGSPQNITSKFEAKGSQEGQQNPLNSEQNHRDPTPWNLNMSTILNNFTSVGVSLCL